LLGVARALDCDRGRGAFDLGDVVRRQLNIRRADVLLDAVEFCGARFNNMALRMNAALVGLGLAYVPEDQVQQHVAKGSLVRVLGDWCAPFSGYHLYYPSRRQAAPAFAVLVEALRYRGSSRG
jgi:DNA-binding transcriptional LysR family regulator